MNSGRDDSWERAGGPAHPYPEDGGLGSGATTITPEPTGGAGADPSNPTFSAPLPIVDAIGAVPTTRRWRGLFWVAALVGTAMVIAGTATAIVRFIDERKPGGVVERYFDALTHGDASAALGFGDVPRGPRDLLSQSVLRAQLNNGRISNVAVLAESNRGAITDVDVQYALTSGGRTISVTDRITLVRKGHSWRLQSSAIPVNIAFSGATDRLSVAGAVPPTGRHLVFPGAAPFSFDTPNLQFTQQTAVIRFSQMSTPFVVEPSRQGSQTMLGAMQAGFASCLVGKSAVQASCPVPSDGIRAVPGSFTGAIKGNLTANLTFAAAANPIGVLTAVSTIAASGPYRALDFNNMASPAQFNGTLTVQAYAFAKDPAKIYWGTP